MATVTNNVTRFDALESGSTVVSRGGGPGAGFDAGVLIQGGGSWSRRQASRTNHGAEVNVTAVDLSAANMHACLWHQHLNGGSALLSNIQVIIGTGANEDLHTFDNNDYPDTGGFTPIWVDVSRTPEATNGTGLNEASCDTMGIELDIGAAAGTTNNFYLDACQYTTTGYLLTGTGGTFADFATFEGNTTTGRFGVLIEQSAGTAVFARLTLGSASSLVFDDSGFSLTWVDQALVSTTFMGITCDLQNASTDIAMSNGTLQSSNVAAAGTRPDFIVTGTSGTLDLTAVNILGMRTMTLTSACTLTDCILDLVDLTQGSGEITGGTLRTRTASTVAVCDDATFGASGIHDLTVSQEGSGHAFEITAAGSYDLQGITFTGYGANTTNDAALFINVASGTVTLNISNGGSTPTYRLPGGSTATVVINNAVNLVFNGIVSGSALIIVANETVGSVTIGDTILSETITADPFSSSFNFEGDIEVDYRVVKGTHAPVYKPVEVTATITSAGLSENIVQQPD